MSTETGTIPEPESLRLGPVEPAKQHRTRRPLSWRAEARRQLNRRRTLGSLILIGALPLVIVAAFAIGRDQEGGGNAFVDLAQQSAGNFVVFVLFVTASLLLVILTSLFCGDTVPAEASWSTLRYLLTGPVPRARLLSSKMIIGLVSTVIAVVLLLGWSLLVGGVAYGWAPFTGLSGVQLAWPVFLLRLAMIAGYLLVNLLQVAAIALWISVRTDAPLAAVGGALMVVIVSSILDQINALGAVRHGLPLHFTNAWIDLLDVHVDTLDLQRGMLWSVLYAVVFGSWAYVHFLRKDVLS